METKNLFATPGQISPNELIETLIQADGVTVERIVSRGHTSAPGFWYDQERHELVILLAGRAILEFADPPARVEMKPGDYLVISARDRHRVAWTDPAVETLWIAIHYQG